MFIEITPQLARRKHLDALDYKFVISRRYRRVTSLLTFRKNWTALPHSAEMET
jgi:hypothetical protein